MKRVTSSTVFQDAVGMRMSITYSVIDDETGRIIEDNKRVTRVLTDATQIAQAQAVVATAQAYVDTLD